MILLILVVLLWMAVLAPSGWRRFSERQGAGSIENFHHQLRLLEHAGPKSVAPAYRLHTAMPRGAATAPVSAPDSDASRPKLVLLRPTRDAAFADIDGGDGRHYERVGVLDRPELEYVPDPGADLHALRRDQARRRCTLLLRGLIGVVISTGLIGLLPGAHLAWVCTGLAGMAALGLLGLMAYARELEAEQDRRRARTFDAVRSETGRALEPTHSEPDPRFERYAPAASGTRGSWAHSWEDDDSEDFDLPRVAAR